MAYNTTGSAGMKGATIPTVPGNVLNLMIAKARVTPQLDGNVASLVFNDPLPPAMGTTYNSPKLGNFTAFSASEGVDSANWQALSSTNVVVTPGEVVVQTAFTKKSLAQWTENLAAKAGEIMRRAMDRKVDADIGGLFGSLNLSAGGAGLLLNIGILSAAVSRLAGGANTTGTAIAAGQGTDVSEEGPYHGVFRPESLGQLTVTTIGSSAFLGGPSATHGGVPSGGVSQELAQRGPKTLFTGTLAGVDLYRCANLAKDSSDDVEAAVFTEMSMIFVPFRHEGADASVHVAESDDGRTLLLTYCEDYGFGELDGNKGVCVAVDATPLAS